MPLTVCPKCSSFVSDGAAFCPSCGLSLHDAERSRLSTEPSQGEGAAPPISPSPTPRFLGRHRYSLSLVVALIAAIIVLGISFRHRIQTALSPSVAVLSVSPTRDALPSSGGTVVISARVGHATECTVNPLSNPHGVGISVQHRSGRCSAGRFSPDVVVGQNPLQHGQNISFRVVARGGHRTSRSRPIVVTVEPSVSEPSSNWAGYIQASSDPLTGVSATWTIPLLHCATGNGGLAAWVGVDGEAELNSSFKPKNNLFQAGSESACVNGQQYDDMWWEWYPVNLSNPVLAVNPGDTVTASLVHETYQGQRGWWWVVTDHTTGQSQAAQSPVTYDGPGATADFIVEDPGTFGKGNAQQPFVGFTPISFSKMLVTTDSPPSYAPFSFASFDPTGVVDMIRQQGNGMKTFVDGSLPTETPYGYGTMTVTYVGP